MDWLKLFALLVAFSSVHITADGPKKKIRIHLPQKVKHIHHHKKIYITNHPASSQYAPAFMPSAEGAVGVPANVAMPAAPGMLNSVEMYEESPPRLPAIASALSKLLPLYRARGYYGPAPAEWDEQDYDETEQTDSSYSNDAFTSQSDSTGPSNYPQQKVKVIKINEPTRKKTVRKIKPKRRPIRNKLQSPQPASELEDEHPVTKFHEQFYSDLDSTGVIKKVKKSPRVEKIIDGGTEHIHTYSEEHIHKLVYGDKPKTPRVVGVEPVLAMAQSLAPLINSQALIAIPSDTHTAYPVIASLTAASNPEYSNYNSQEVTHNHIFHDHGEIPAGVDITKDHFRFPPKATYSSQGLRIGVGAKGLRGRYPQKYFKPHLKPSQLTDFSYYKQMYAPYNQFRNFQKPTPFELSNEDMEDYRPIKLKNKGATKIRHLAPYLYYGQGKQLPDYRQQQTAPYSMSSTIVHDYKPKYYSDQSVGLPKLNKDIYDNPNNNYEYDTMDSSASNVYAADNYQFNIPTKKGIKKPISTQNFNILAVDHHKTTDQFDDSDLSGTTLNAAIPTAFDNSYDQKKPKEMPHPSAFMIKEISPVHPYYRAMAMKALHSGDYAAASVDNYQYAMAPSPSTTAKEAVIATAATAPEYYDGTNSKDNETEARNAINNQNSEVITVHKEPGTRYKVITIESKGSKPVSNESKPIVYKPDSGRVTGKLKYGDKI